MFYTRSLKFFWQRTKQLQAHQILSLYTLSTLILYTVYDLKDFYATPDWWSSAWSSASCFLLPAEYHTVCPYTPNLRKSEYIIWSVFCCSGNVRMRSWANNKQKETARPSLCVFQAQISLDTMWRRLISACFSTRWSSNFHIFKIEVVSQHHIMKPWETNRRRRSEDNESS